MFHAHESSEPNLTVSRREPNLCFLKADITDTYKTYPATVVYICFLSQTRMVARCDTADTIAANTFKGLEK